MRINEKGTNMQITPEIKDYLFKKLEYLEKHLGENSVNALCEVELGKTTNHHRTGDIFRTEINLRIEGNHLRAVAEGEELFATIDQVKDELARQLESNKDRRVSLLRRSGAKIKNLIKGFFPNPDQQ